MPFLRDLAPCLPDLLGYCAPRPVGPRNRVLPNEKKCGDGLERRPPAGIARERETSGGGAAPCQPACDRWAKHTLVLAKLAAEINPSSVMPLTPHQFRNLPGVAAHTHVCLTENRGKADTRLHRGRLAGNRRERPSWPLAAILAIYSRPGLVGHVAAEIEHGDLSLSSEPVLRGSSKGILYY